MKVLNYECTKSAQDECGAGHGVDSNLSFHLVAGFEVEGVKSKATQLSGLATAGSWGFTRSDLNLVAEFVTLEFAGMNGSSVVSTGGNSGPRADAFSWGNEGQRVANVDVDDLIPTDRNRPEWVGDDYTLIENLKLWSNEYQVGRDAESQSPQAARNSQVGFLGQPKGYREKQAKREDQPGKKIAAARPKDLSITHVSIIAGEK